MEQVDQHHYKVRPGEQIKIVLKPAWMVLVAASCGDRPLPTEGSRGRPIVRLVADRDLGAVLTVTLVLATPPHVDDPSCTIEVSSHGRTFDAGEVVGKPGEAAWVRLKFDMEVGPTARPLRRSK